MRERSKPDNKSAKKSVKKVAKKAVKKVVKKAVKKAAKKAVKNISVKKFAKKRVLKTKKLDPQDLDFKYLGKNDKWLIVELTEDCDLKENAESVVQQLKGLCGDGVEYFLPLYTEYVRDKPVRIVLFEGYIFIRVTEEITDSSFKDRTEHISGPLMCGGRCQYLKNREINGFKSELKKGLKDKIPKKGQTVIPKVGDYKNLEGVVLSVDKTKMIAKVEFAFSSRVVEVGIRIINLEVME